MESEVHFDRKQVEINSVLLDIREMVITVVK